MILDDNDACGMMYFLLSSMKTAMIRLRAIEILRFISCCWHWYLMWSKKRKTNLNSSLTSTFFFRFTHTHREICLCRYISSIHQMFHPLGVFEQNFKLHCEKVVKKSQHYLHYQKMISQCIINSVCFRSSIEPHLI